MHPDITTLRALKAAGYQSRPVKDEVRHNLITHLRNHTTPFNGIIGYEHTVIPDVERALLSRHNILFLGLRGQAKTRLARNMVSLLDEWLPYVAGSEINDDPFQPISVFARELIARKGDDTPIAWLHRSERYSEKLATPDVSVADLIGDIDPVKAANMRLTFADERVLHYGIIPRSHRGIFVINELPDLQARIQVALFNILQEGDIQIRGFKLRMPLDILFVFTANPEDYTNRGSIVTPLKDRIASQIMTHYPENVAQSQAITAQEARLAPGQETAVQVPDICKILIEHLAMQARKSDFVDQKSGVSARLTISAYENLVSSAERRALRFGEEKTTARIADFAGVIPALTGKVELVYEGELEGPANVAYRLLGQALRATFLEYFPDPETFKKSGPEKGTRKTNPYQPVVDWFGHGHEVTLLQDMDAASFQQELYRVSGLYGCVQHFYPKANQEEAAILMELLLHGLSEFSLISKKAVAGSGFAFQDMLGSMLGMDFGADDE